MFGWSFRVSTVAEWGRLLRALEKHRYLAEVDHRLHWSVDMVLAALHEARPGEHPELARFAAAARRIPADLERGSRDPRAWRAVSVDDVEAALSVFWGPRRDEASRALRAVLEEDGVPPTTHPVGEADPEEPPHPELVLLDWVLLPVEALDTERHRGALRAMEELEEEVHASEPVYVEGPIIAEPELTRGPWPDPIFWANEPYAYADYLFRGVSRAAKLEEPPLGWGDLD